MNKPHYPIVALVGRRQVRRDPFSVIGPSALVTETTYGAGKDTVADHMVEAYGFKKIQFADPLKRAAEAVGIPSHLLHESGGREQVVTIGDVSLTVRQHLHHIARRVKELYGESVWLDQTDRQCAQREQPIVISDLRYGYELDWLLEKGGRVLLVSRVEWVGSDYEITEADADDHESEQSLLWEIEEEFQNTGPIDCEWKHRLTRTLTKAGVFK